MNSRNEAKKTSEKYSLSINEAAQYFSIGIKKMRRLAEDNLDTFAVYSGNRYLIIRSRFEEYLLNRRTTEEGGEEVYEKTSFSREGDS